MSHEVQDTPQSAPADLGQAQALTKLLVQLKACEMQYVAALLTMRTEYLSHGRRAHDVQELAEILRQKAKRALDRVQNPALSRVAKMVRASLHCSLHLSQSCPLVLCMRLLLT